MPKMKFLMNIDPKLKSPKNGIAQTEATRSPSLPGCHLFPTATAVLEKIELLMEDNFKDTTLNPPPRLNRSLQYVSIHFWISSDILQEGSTWKIVHSKVQLAGFARYQDQVSWTMEKKKKPILSRVSWL